jgi:hypothetical protein
VRNQKHRFKEEDLVHVDDDAENKAIVSWWNCADEL